MLGKHFKRLPKSRNEKWRGSHGANFAVLRGFNGPVSVVEMGFISNTSDVEKRLRKKTKDRLQGILRQEYENSLNDRREKR